VFVWYAALPPNSINSGDDLEHKFDEHFFSRDYELDLVDLASVQQKDDESVNDYIQRIWNTRNQCFQIQVKDQKLAGLAFNGLHPYLKEKLDSTQFFLLTQLHPWALAWLMKVEAKSRLIMMSVMTVV
jgi:hypothetical protein